MRAIWLALGCSCFKLLVLQRAQPHTTFILVTLLLLSDKRPAGFKSARAARRSQIGCWGGR